ncbi:MAG: YkgJ family cysteine cluster protein [FCB group bacterium]|nr:YkgJ family cysteine cluster protein [FCB group bacterium]
MGKDIVHFKCHSCGHCCTDVVCLPTPWDVIRIVRGTGLKPLDFLEFITPDQISGVYKTDPTWLECGGQHYMMALQRGPKGCHFLDKKTKLCSIYEHRPILCRLYPLRVQETKDGEFKGFTLHTNVGCPKNRDAVILVEPMRQLYVDDSEHHEDYRELVRVFNARRDKHKRPEDFIQMFVTEGR